MKINTLHICNLDEVINFHFYWEMIAPQDQIIFYAQSINNDQYNELDRQQPLIKKHYQSILKNNTFSNLSMEKWLQLVKTANKTMTWK